MGFFGFRYAPGAWNLNDGWHLLVAEDFALEQVLGFANENEDGCTVQRIEWLGIAQGHFKAHIRNIKKTIIGQDAKNKFHLIYSTKDGRLYRQTIRNEKKWR